MSRCTAGSRADIPGLLGPACPACSWPAEQAGQAEQADPELAAPGVSLEEQSTPLPPQAATAAAGSARVFQPRLGRDDGGGVAIGGGGGMIGGGSQQTSPMHDGLGADQNMTAVGPLIGDGILADPSGPRPMSP